MAEPFASLATSIPGWIQRLDILATQVKQRQRDLARVAGEQGTAETGATEETPGTSAGTSATAVDEMAGASVAAHHAYRNRSMIRVYYDSYVQSFFEDLVRFLASSRNQLRKAKLAARVALLRESMTGMAADGGGGGGGGVDHRNRRPWTQTWTQTPAAEETGGPDLEVGDGAGDGDDDDASAPGDDAGGMVLPSLLGYKRTMAMRSPGVLAAGRPQYWRASGRAVNLEGVTATATAATETKDVHDSLDQTLEAVQALCEHTAHRFLRDGTCGDGVATIRRRLAETEAAAAAAAAANGVEEK